MALKIADRVLETTSTSGTGTLSLGGPVNGYQSFITGVGSGNTTFYTIYDQTAQVWEVGIGTVTAGTPNTLSRSIVLSNSSGTTSPISLAGNSASVWVDYPAEKATYLDASGNVSPLGTITSGVWNGSIIPTLYGGTGTNTSTGPNSVVLRDAFNNITANNFNASIAVTTSSGGTIVLTEGSAYYQKLTGTTTETYQLPQANLIPSGLAFIFDNDSTGTLTVIDNASSTIQTLQAGEIAYIYLEDNSTSAGTWGNYGLLPNQFQFSTTSASFGNTPIINATWNGNPIAYNYGGTGLTTFSAANYALYSTSPTTLTAGTLPVAAGGTGATSLTGYVYGNGTGPFTASTTVPGSVITGDISGNATNITSYPLNQSVATSASPTFAALTTTNNLIVNGTLYDGSNTAYYIKPSGLSNLSSLDVGGSPVVTNNGGTYGINISGYADHLFINGSNASSTWNWAGQGGQPSWLWGSNDGTNMYVWNPSNFNVNYANTAGNGVTVTGGSPPYYGARAWVNFYGNGASIRGSVNVSSISRTTTGGYTVYFSTNMPDTNFCAVTGIGVDTSYSGYWTIAKVYGFAVNYVQIESQSGGNAYDSNYIGVAIFR
jgi:hypothetical protein